MVYLIDRSSVGNIHVMFNAGMLSVFKSIFPKEKIVFISEKSHLEFVKSKMGENNGNISFVEEPLVKSVGSGGKKIIQWIQKLRLDYKFYKKMLHLAKEEKNTLLFFCSVPPISLPILTRLYKKQHEINVLITLHGEIESLFYPTGNKDNLMARIYKNSFKGTTDNLSYLLLNKISKVELSKAKFLPGKNMLEITHPYFYEKTILPKKEAIIAPVKLGHIGSLGKRKNGEHLFDLAQLLKSEIQANNIQIQAIGPIESDCKYAVNEFVICQNSNTQYMDRRTFEALIEKLDYALFFYGPSQFIFRASGAIFDVIEYGKPIIAYKHPYFEQMFKEAGDIGFLCEDMNDMVTLIKQLGHNNTNKGLTQRYEKQQQNLLAYKEKVSIENIAIDLKAQLLHRNYI